MRSCVRPWIAASPSPRPLECIAISGADGAFEVGHVAGDAAADLVGSHGDRRSVAAQDRERRRRPDIARALGHTIVADDAGTGPAAALGRQSTRASPEYPRTWSSRFGSTAGAGAPARLDAVDAFRHQRSGRARMHRVTVFRGELEGRTVAVTTTSSLRRTSRPWIVAGRPR